MNVQKKLNSDRAFNELWCGGAAKYLEEVKGKHLERGVSPCAIITVPINHNGTDHSVKYENMKIMEMWTCERYGI